MSHESKAVERGKAGETREHLGGNVASRNGWGACWGKYRGIWRSKDTGGKRQMWMTRKSGTHKHTHKTYVHISIYFFTHILTPTALIQYFSFSFPLLTFHFYSLLFQFLALILSFSPSSTPSCFSIWFLFPLLGHILHHLLPVISNLFLFLLPPSYLHVQSRAEVLRWSFLYASSLPSPKTTFTGHSLLSSPRHWSTYISHLTCISYLFN